MADPFHKVLLVDDDGPTNFLHQLILKKHAFAEEVVAFQGVPEALDYLQNDDPDIIFLDVNMPAYSGWDFLRMYREQVAEKNIPIVMVTTSLDPKDRQMAMSFEEVVDFIYKPLTQDLLREVVSRLKEPEE